MSRRRPWWLWARKIRTFPTRLRKASTLRSKRAAHWRWLRGPVIIRKRKCLRKPVRLSSIFSRGLFDKGAIRQNVALGAIIDKVNLFEITLLNDECSAPGLIYPDRRSPYAYVLAKAHRTSICPAALGTAVWHRAGGLDGARQHRQGSSRLRKVPPYFSPSALFARPEFP